MFCINNAGWLRRKVLLISLVAVVASCGEGVNEKELIDRARGYIEKQDINAATLELKNVLRNNAKNGEARYLLGKISLGMGDMKTAQKELNRALDSGWDEALVQLALAEVQFRQGNFRNVLDDIPVKDSFPAAVRADLIGLWAASEASLGKWDEAERTVRTGESIGGDSFWLLLSKIRLQIHNKDNQAVEQVLQHALKVHPDSQDLWLIKAGLAEEKGELENASAALQKAIELDPPRNITERGRQARLAQGQILMQQQEYEKALAAVAPVLSIYPGDPKANHLSALINFKQGKYDQAEERLQMVMKIAPEHQPSLLLFGSLYFTRGDYQQAAYYLEKAVTMQPENTDAQTLLGRAYLMLGQYDEARDRLEFASSKTGDNAELLALVGISQMKGGNTQAGLTELEKAAQTAPDDRVIRNELALAYMTSGDTTRAISTLEAARDGNKSEYQSEVLLLMAYLRASAFDKALVLATQLSRQLPDNPLPHNLAGVAHEGKQDVSSARREYEAAIGLQPDNIMSMLSLARLDMLAGNADLARKRYQTALEIHPDNAATLVALAQLENQAGKLTETLDLLEKARRVDEHAIRPRLTLSRYYLDQGMADKALLYANEALKISPQEPQAILVVGRAQLGLGNAAAVQTLKNLTERLPDSANAHYYLAEAQARFGDTASTRQSLNRVIELQPDHELAMRVLGRLELSQGKADAALKIAQRLKKTLPESAAGYLLEGDTLLIGGDKKGALKAYQLAHDRAGKDGEAAIKISRTQRALGNSGAAYDVLHGWLKQHTEDQQVRLVLAMSYLADGKKDQAMSQYEQVLQKQPENASALNDLAWLYHETGRKEAAEMAEKAYRLSPDNAAIQDTYGWILVQTGKIESGLIALEQAVSNAPDSSSIRYHLAAALAKAGEKARAKEELSAILQSDKKFSERAAAEALHREL